MRTLAVVAFTTVTSTIWPLAANAASDGPMPLVAELPATNWEGPVPGSNGLQLGDALEKVQAATAELGPRFHSQERDFKIELSNAAGDSVRYEWLREIYSEAANMANNDGIEDRRTYRFTSPATGSKLASIEKEWNAFKSENYLEKASVDQAFNDAFGEPSLVWSSGQRLVYVWVDGAKVKLDEEDRGTSFYGSDNTLREKTQNCVAAFSEIGAAAPDVVIGKVAVGKRIAPTYCSGYAEALVTPDYKNPNLISGYRFSISGLASVTHDAVAAFEVLKGRKDEASASKPIKQGKQLQGL